MERQQIINARKPRLPFTLNPEAAEKQQVMNIQKSAMSPQEKIIRLNQMSEIYNNKLKLKGKSQHLEIVSEINLARAQIMLSERGDTSPC